MRKILLLRAKDFVRLHAAPGICEGIFSWVLSSKRDKMKVL